MAKNIEININTNGTSYEVLYPKTTADLVNAGTFNGTFTFSNAPNCNVAPSSANHLVRKSYADNLVNGMATQSWVTQQLNNLGGGSAGIAYKTYNGNGSKSLELTFSGKGTLYAFYVNNGEIGPNTPPCYMAIKGNGKAVFHIDSGNINRGASLTWYINSVDLSISTDGLDYLNASGVKYSAIGLFG